MPLRARLRTKTKRKKKNIKTMKNYKAVLAVTALGVAGFAQVSLASFPTSPGLYMYDSAVGIAGAVSVTSLTDGNYNFDGTVGDYQVSIVTGQTLEGGFNPILDLQVTDAFTTQQNDQLYIYFSNGQFGPSDGPYSLSTTGPQSSTQNNGSSTYAGYSGSVFGNASNLGGSANSAPYTLNASGSLVSSSLYYLTMLTTVFGNTANSYYNNVTQQTTYGYGVASLDSTLTVVPEPTTVAAAALMLLPLGIGAVRSLRKERGV